MLEGVTRSGGKPPSSTPPSFPQSLSRYAKTVRGVESLTRVLTSGMEFKAAYLVVNGQFHFHQNGHLDIINRIGEDVIEKSQPSHYGWFKVIPPSGARKKTLFIIDSYSDLNRGRVNERRWDLLSLDEYFAFFYLLLINSGARKFSIRLSSADKRAAGVNENNWKKTSQLLFMNEKIEEEFIRQLSSTT